MRKRSEYTDLVDKTVTDEEFKTELIAALEKERGGESGSATLAPRPPRRRGGVRVITGVAACLVACACLVMCIIALTRDSGLPVPGGEIRSCLVTGSVYAYRSSGALYECMGTVTDSLSLCTVLSADPDLEGRGFIGIAETSSVIENCYAVNEGPFVPVIDKADVTTQFVYERLGWSPDVWTDGADGLPDLAWRTAV